MSVAAAPSVRKLEFAAVCVPCGLTNAGWRLASFSSVESPLMPFSAVLPPTGVISASYRPAACALAAFWCDASAN